MGWWAGEKCKVMRERVLWWGGRERGGRERKFPRTRKDVSLVFHENEIPGSMYQDPKGIKVRGF